MKLITKNSDYAIQALLSLAQKKNTIVSVEMLVRDMGLPRAFLRRLLQDLVEHGIVISKKGQGGGFILAQKPEQIHIIDVMRVFQGDVKLLDCRHKHSICPNQKHCPLRNTISIIERDTIKKLQKITLASLLKK